jgi:cytochrome b
MKTDTKPVRVWDLPTRLFHWSLVASFATAFLTSESEKLRDIHVLAGYSLAGLIVFRLLWGFIGGAHSRFADFLPTPRKVIDYVKSLVDGEPQHYVGHNPAGAVAIFALLGLGFAAAASGWAVYEDMGGTLHGGTARGSGQWHDGRRCHPHCRRHRQQLAAQREPGPCHDHRLEEI